MILDQLEHLVLEHDGPRGGRQILADLEGLHIDLGGHTPIIGQVFEHVGEAFHQAGSARLVHLLHSRWIAQQRVSRGHGIGEEREDEARPVGILFVQICIVNKGIEALLPGQIGLHVHTVKGIRFPGLVGEAFVLGIRLDGGLPGHHPADLEHEI